MDKRKLSIFTRLGRVGQGLLDLVFPPRCLVCRQPGTSLCDDCRCDFPRVPLPVCQLCGQPTYSSSQYCWRCRRMPLKIDGIRSVVLFEGGVRQAIHRLKYRNQTVLAKPLAQLMADYWDESPMPADLLIPVPLHSARHRQRGYNQADLLARELGRIIDLPVQTTGLQRTRDTKSQMSLSVSDRVQNMREAFVYQPHKRQNGSGVSGKHVLVIDDVCTTGATLEACSVSLKSAGAFDVWGFTLARAILATDK